MNPNFCKSQRISLRKIFVNDKLKMSKENLRVMAEVRICECCASWQKLQNLDLAHK